MFRNKILIDANSAVLRRNMKFLPGIGRTTLELINALNRVDKNGLEIGLYTQQCRLTKPFQLKTLSNKHLPLPGNQRVKKVIMDFCFNRQFPRFDLLHVPHNFEALANPERALVTIHDAMFFSYPEDFLGHQFARENYPKLAKACKGIVTCSNASKSDIVYFMGIHPDKITVIPWGINHQLFSPGKEEEINLLCSKNRIDRPYFLMVSCDIGRKNTLTLMKAYHLFAKSDPEHMLILVWNNPPKSYKDQFSREIENDCIRFEGGINDETLHLLYAGASASFFPSRYEGFGLPVLESMACGTPVITCRNSALQEVGSNAALYIDPDDVRGMADIMKAFEKNTIDRKDLSEKSLVHAQEFTWEKTARAYINFYKKYLEN